jgi:4-diphosphocytidyl-2C-methyl-D-erythritol kinase
MTGSGSAIFALLPRREDAERLLGRLQLGTGVTAHVLGPWHRSVSLGMG